MTTRDFIQAKFGLPAKRTTTCSSVIADTNGNIFSYGWHYPLLFEIAGIRFRNVRGYSVTTSKHIGYCYGFGAHDVEIPPHVLRIDDLDLDSPQHQARLLRDIKKWLVEEMTAITWEQLGKKRKDTRVYQELQGRLESRDELLQEIDTVLNTLETEVLQPA